jgi:hypothetical protein
MMVIGQSEPWHSFNNSHCYMTMILINGQYHVEPIFLGDGASDSINQDPSEMVWIEHWDGEVKPSNVGP